MQKVIIWAVGFDNGDFCGGFDTKEKAENFAKDCRQNAEVFHFVGTWGDGKECNEKTLA